MGERVVFCFRHVTMDHVKSKVIHLDGPWTMAGDGIRRSLQVCPIDTCWACSLPKMMPFEI